ncbi:sortase B protein-sorting domain-containing protein [Coprococcus sp. TM115-141]
MPKPKAPASDAKDKVPETGDSSSMTLYLVLMGITAMSGALVLRRKSK